MPSTQPKPTVTRAVLASHIPEVPSVASAYPFVDDPAAEIVTADDNPMNLLKKVSNMLDKADVPASVVSKVNPKTDLVFVLFGCALRVLMAVQLGSVFLHVSLIDI